MKRALMLLVALSVLSGCSEMNQPFDDNDAVARRGLTRGYTEVRQDKTILVASTPEGVEHIRRGEEPKAKIAAFGFGPAGEKVIFEASKDGKLEEALMAEFERRHGRK